MTARVRVREDAPAVGRSIRDLEIATETGMWVMAIRSGDAWEFAPGPDDVLSADDVLLVRGPAEGVPLLRGLAGGPSTPEVEEDEAPPLSELDRAVDILVEMKDLAEAAVGLAYSSLLFNNRALAAEGGYEYETVPETGHLLQIERPDASREAMLSFLRKHNLA